MTKTLHILTIITIFLVSCTGSTKTGNTNNVVKSDTLIKPSQPLDKSSRHNPNDYYLPPLDSTIIIDKLKALMSDVTITPPLTLSKTKKLLYAFYRKKDFFIEGNIPKDYDKNKIYNTKGEFKYDIQFDTAEFFNLNNDNIPDAIVQFEMTPPYGSSHCYGYPTKALILSKGNSFSLAGVNFIPEFYILDSIRQQSKNSVFLFGFDYDCPNWLINRSFRIKLKVKE